MGAEFVIGSELGHGLLATCLRRHALSVGGIPIVLGLGGWFLGVLIVISTTPGVPLDDELLAMLSIGLPIGLGVYLAWVNRDRPAQRRGLGLAAAVAGALAGAWLGFHATADLPALVTGIAGAVAGANLALIGLDLSQARSAGATATRADARRASVEPAVPTPTGTP